ncbi:MAG: Ferredoxin, partial [uncultured Thermomicrobiales bacterium]
GTDRSGRDQDVRGAGRDKARPGDRGRGDRHPPPVRRQRALHDLSGRGGGGRCWRDERAGTRASGARAGTRPQHAAVLPGAHPGSAEGAGPAPPQRDRHERRRPAPGRGAFGGV